MDDDIIITGAGPAGLSLACSLAGHGLSVTLVERQSAGVLEAPPFDGREIALTHRSVDILNDLSAWDDLAPVAAPMRAARVLNGRSSFALGFEGRGADGTMGWLVPNHAIRRALHRAAIAKPDVRILAEAEVSGVETTDAGVTVRLRDGRALRGRLLVAADSRFSQVRDMLGIAARVHRLGRSMMVCRMEHERDHDRVATEWFDHHQTLALLPLHGRMSSAVVTLPTREAAALMALDDAAFEAEITRRFAGRMGRMRLAGTRHLYPLAITWARRFAARRAALAGDAAVGMHPVTAHGFNLGLMGQRTLAREVLRAVRRHGDPGRDGALRRYEMRHRLASRPLYDATNAIVALYTREDAVARVARPAVLRLSQGLPFVRRGVGALLAPRHAPGLIP